MWALIKLVIIYTGNFSALQTFYPNNYVCVFVCSYLFVYKCTYMGYTFFLILK